jgi:hypothetical protein
VKSGASDDFGFDQDKTIETVHLSINKSGGKLNINMAPNSHLMLPLDKTVCKSTHGGISPMKLDKGFGDYINRSTYTT